MKNQDLVISRSGKTLTRLAHSIKTDAAETVTDYFSPLKVAASVFGVRPPVLRPSKRGSHKAKPRPHT